MKVCLVSDRGGGGIYVNSKDTLRDTDSNGHEVHLNDISNFRKHINLHYKDQSVVLCREIIAACSENHTKHVESM